MSGKRTKMIGALVAVVMGAALAAPTAAMAAFPSRTYAAAPVRTAAAQQSAQDNLRRQIDGTLAARKARFDAANASFSSGISRVSALADRVAAAGGNVRPVRLKLAEAKKHLARASVLEKRAVAAFNAVPTASNKRAALLSARAKGRAAVLELNRTRTSIRQATANLRVAINRTRLK